MRPYLSCFENNIVQLCASGLLCTLVNGQAAYSGMQSNDLTRHSSFAGFRPDTNPSTGDEIELASGGVVSHEGDGPQHEIEQTDLPQPDSGKAASLFLCACFMVEAMCWGRLHLVHLL